MTVTAARESFGRVMNVVNVAEKSTNVLLDLVLLFDSEFAELVCFL